MRAREFAILCLAAWFLSGLASPTAAAEKGDKQIRFGVLYSMPTDDLVQGTQKTELDDSLGLQAGFEFAVTDRVGIEAGISSTRFDFTDEDPPLFSDTGDTRLLAVTVDVHFHFEKESGLDLFVGPTVGYALWDDLEIDGFPFPVDTDDEFMFGVHFGLDHPIGDGPWSFSTGLTYLVLDIVPPGAEIGVSPLQVRAGVGYSF